MRPSIYSSRYFIALGLLIFLCFSLIVWFISGKLQTQTKRISTDAATKVFQLKSVVIRQEFESFGKSMEHALIAVSQFKSAREFLGNRRLAEAHLLSNPRVSKIWFAVRRPDGAILYPDSTATRRALSDSLLSADPAASTQSLISHERGERHWLVASATRLADSAVVILGMDIDLMKLQHHLQRVDTAGRASVFIVGQDGTYITGPEEQLIGTRLNDIPPSGPALGRLADSITTYEQTRSSYLQIQVLRYYTPIKVVGAEWTMVIDTPLLAVDEDVRVIDKYVTAFFVITAILILLLIAWSQTKWRREFMLRQAVELKEKQQQKDNALLQLSVLKEKVNPHFLFNSLTSLSALIGQDEELARSFVLKLSKVYRYVLEPFPDGLAPVEEELRFVREYFFLLKIRFGDALRPLDIDINQNLQHAKIPFMSLQLLIENAVKHNVVSKERPLDIRIYSEGNGITVSNNLQLRENVSPSGKQGLSYLSGIYAFFGNYPLYYRAEDSRYICHLPFIQVNG